MLLTNGGLGSEGHPRDFHVSWGERIVAALVFGAVSSDLWLFVVFIIPRFGHAFLQARAAACQGRVRRKQGRACRSHDSPGAEPPSARTGSAVKFPDRAVCGPSQPTQQRAMTDNDADQQAVFPLVSIAPITGPQLCLVSQKILSICLAGSIAWKSVARW
jgi:hypothetical protein